MIDKRSKKVAARKFPAEVLREAAERALIKILGPVIEFGLDAGLSVRQVESLMRSTAIDSIARRHRSVSGRVSVSRIAAATGLSRTEVSALLRNGRRNVGNAAKAAQFTNRVLNAWHHIPRFLDEKGTPRILNLYGKKRLSFESLVVQNGGGVPVRALMDELSQIGAIDLLPGQRVKVNVSAAVYRGLNPAIAEVFGDRAHELLSTILENLRGSQEPKFVSTIETNLTNQDLVPRIRREIGNRGSHFLSKIQESVFPEPKTTKGPAKQSRSVNAKLTLFYFDDVGEEKPTVSWTVRKNYRRVNTVEAPKKTD